MAEKIEIPVSDAAADKQKERRWAGIVFHGLGGLGPANSHKNDVTSGPAAYNLQPPLSEGQTEESVQNVNSNLKVAVAKLVATGRSQLTSLDKAKTEHVILTVLAAAAAGKSTTIDALFRAAKIEAAAPQTEIVSLSRPDAEAFFAFATADENQWSKSSGVLPSSFIAEKFAPWLGRGLGLRNVRKAQPALATFYSLEVSRAPAKRVPDLYVKPRTLPIAAPASKSRRRVAELTAEELINRRAERAARQKVYRKGKKLASADGKPSPT